MYILDPYIPLELFRGWGRGDNQHAFIDEERTQKAWFYRFHVTVTTYYNRYKMTTQIYFEQIVSNSSRKDSSLVFLDFFFFFTTKTVTGIYQRGKRSVRAFIERNGIIRVVGCQSWFLALTGSMVDSPEQLSTHLRRRPRGDGSLISGTDEWGWWTARLVRARFAWWTRIMWKLRTHRSPKVSSASIDLTNSLFRQLPNPEKSPMKKRIIWNVSFPLFNLCSAFRLVNIFLKNVCT